MRRRFLLASLLALVLVPALSATPVSATVTFSTTEGNGGNWTVTVNGSTDFVLDSLVIDLVGGSLYFDPSTTSPGEGDSAPGHLLVTPGDFGGTAPSSISGGTDGDTTFTLNYSSFDSADAATTFILDVDNGGGYSIATSSLFDAGASVTATFTTWAGLTDTFTGYFDSSGIALTTGDIDIPEPSTVMLIGIGLTAIGLIRRRRSA